jgi:hypothetical protein
MRVGWILLCALDAVASLPERPIAPVGSSATSVGIKTRSAEAQSILNKVLSDQTFWADAWRQSYDDELYDELRLKSTDAGYVPMITGEGDADFPHEVVADTVYFRNLDLPKYMSGAKSIQVLGSGYDPTIGAEYRDCFYVLDLTVFYGYFPQRMYRRSDPATHRSVLWFEKLHSSFVDAATWTAYQTKMQASLDGLDRRWPPFNSLVEVTDVYGMFVVEPGTTHTSRVSFVSKVTFGEGAGLVAKWGSQLPMVIKAGIKSGFDASVAIAKKETAKRAAAVVPAPAPAPTAAPPQ